jgi:hypothetical protein
MTNLASRVGSSGDSLRLGGISIKSKIRILFGANNYLTQGRNWGFSGVGHIWPSIQGKKNYKVFFFFFFFSLLAHTH